MSTEKYYYIQNGFVGNAVLWWGKDHQGYTTDFYQAGRYTESEAKKIIERPQDKAYPCEYVDGNFKAQKLIVDGQYLDREKLLKL